MILAIGAHPDDIEYGCLGTLLKADEPWQAFVCSLGNVGDTTTGAHRIAETTEALNRRVLVRAALGLPSMQKLTAILSEEIQARTPRLILTHSPHDTHQDHRKVYAATMSACRRMAVSVWCYGAPSQTAAFAPRRFVNIQHTWDRKLIALECHASQRARPYFNPMVMLAFHTRPHAALRGLTRVEAFEIVQEYA